MLDLERFKEQWGMKGVDGGWWVKQNFEYIQNHKKKPYKGKQKI